MKITLIAVGKGKSHSVAPLLTDYLKRIPWSIYIKEIELKQSLSDNVRIQKEGDAILELLPNGAKVVVLDERGKNIASDVFAGTVGNWQNDGCSHIVFVIGGAFGLSDQVRKRADLLLSFGQMTWPHMMVRLLLVEQVYRAYTILSGHPYHKM